MRLLTQSDIQQSISMREAVEVVKRAFGELSTGRADIPLRTVLSLPKHDGVTLFMPGYLSDSESLAVKVVSVHNRNPERHLPLINAVVIVIDPATGQAVAAIEGGYLTALRTGAGSGAATDLLARRDAEVAAIIGAGEQARAQTLAVAAVRPIKRFWIYARRRARVEEMIAEMRPKLGPSIELLEAHSPSQAVREALVICAATTSSTPVFDGADLRPGAHVNGVGSYRPAMQEIDCATLRRASKIVVDSRESALTEAGDLMIAIERGEIQPSDIYAEIGEIAAGLKAGREDGDEITYFKSVGNAAQDAAVAQAIYQQALRKNLGVEIDLLK
ncbi:MAG TPA: ornithine cyclodeaminase family protein [Blastocatellia bacterium]|nr:ornithine cyclodeaminase family protein [Blastocatellia bacterium]